MTGYIAGLIDKQRRRELPATRSICHEMFSGDLLSAQKALNEWLAGQPDVRVLNVETVMHSQEGTMPGARTGGEIGLRVWFESVLP